MNDGHPPGCFPVMGGQLFSFPEDILQLSRSDHIVVNAIAVFLLFMGIEQLVAGGNHKAFR